MNKKHTFQYDNKFEIVHTDTPVFEHNDKKYAVYTKFYFSYNDWINDLILQRTKIVYLHSLWHQLDLKDGIFDLSKHRILHWVRYRVVERYNKDGSIETMNTIE